ncbi:MAG: DUF6445 family protein [Colwellia sp.]|nr:DUF6445 family protein [Colwellia sp.]
MSQTTEEFNFKVNDELKFDVSYLGNEKTPVVIIDNFCQSPEDIVLFAKKNSQLIPAEKKTNFYPGVISELTNNYNDNMYAALKPIIKKVYRLPVAYPSWLESNFAMISFSPEELNQNQRIPHYDTEGPGQLAILLYLCHPPHQGTALYRHNETGFESIQPKRKEEYWSSINPKLSANFYPNSYVNEGNNDFKQIAKVDLAFNRMVIYPSQTLHSSLIIPELLSENIDEGRLTLRSFISYQ